MAALCVAGAPWPGAVAVSGGSDSLALMHLLAVWAKATKRTAPVVLSVDHGLRKGSAADAKRVAAWAKDAGLRAHILKWRGAKPKSDIESAARQTRYRLMGNWCARNGIGALYVAHTLNDQAETFLLRLARGSGLDGLSAMRAVAPVPVADAGDVVVVRPLLDISRDALRDFLTAHGVDWLEDPMNEDPGFHRVRMRKAAGELGALGLTPQRIADAAAHLARARAALDTAVDEFLVTAVRHEPDVTLLDGAALASLPPELGLRTLARLLSQTASSPYRPRFERLERLYASIVGGTAQKGRTLHGCRIGRAPRRLAMFGPATLAITRERAARMEPGHTNAHIECEKE